MKLILRTFTGANTKVIEAKPTDWVEDIRSQCFFKNHLEINNIELKDGNQLLDYSIEEDSEIICYDCITAGRIAAKRPSKVIGLLEHDFEDFHFPLEIGNLQTRYIRNKNATSVYKQVGGTCYAYAACSAYINTVLRIYGSSQPSFLQCFRIACYNGKKGGKP